MNELKISYTDFLKWLESQPDNKFIGVTHSSSHSFFSRYLQELTKIRAVFVFTYSTKFCRLGKWVEYANPDWMSKLIYETNQLHRTPECTKYYVASLGKQLTKADVLCCINKLSKPKKKSKKAA